MKGRRDPTATSTTSAAVQDITTNEGMSLCGFRGHQYQSCGNAPTRGSIRVVHHIPDRSAVVPPATMVSASEETPTAVGVCEESVTEVDLPGVVSSATLVSVSEDTTTEDVDVGEESEIDVGLPVVIPSAELVSVSEDPSRNVDVWETSEIDIPVVVDFDSLNTALGKESGSSEPTILSKDTEPKVVMLSPEVELEDCIL